MRRHRYADSEEGRGRGRRKVKPSVTSPPHVQQNTRRLRSANLSVELQKARAHQRDQYHGLGDVASPKVHSIRGSAYQEVDLAVSGDHLHMEEKRKARRSVPLRLARSRKSKERKYKEEMDDEEEADVELEQENIVPSVLPSNESPLRTGVTGGNPWSVQVPRVARLEESGDEKEDGGVDVEVEEAEQEADEQEHQQHQQEDGDPLRSEEDGWVRVKDPQTKASRVEHTPSPQGSQKEEEEEEESSSSATKKTSPVGGTVASFIHRFRNEPPLSREEREKQRSMGKLWWQESEEEEEQSEDTPPLDNAHVHTHAQRTPSPPKEHHALHRVSSSQLEELSASEERILTQMKRGQQQNPELPETPQHVREVVRQEAKERDASVQDVKEANGGSREEQPVLSDSLDALFARQYGASHYGNFLDAQAPNSPEKTQSSWLQHSLEDYERTYGSMEEGLADEDNDDDVDAPLSDSLVHQVDQLLDRDLSDLARELQISLGESHEYLQGLKAYRDSGELDGSPLNDVYSSTGSLDSNAELERYLEELRERMNGEQGSVDEQPRKQEQRQQEDEIDEGQEEGPNGEQEDEEQEEQEEQEEEQHVHESHDVSPTALPKTSKQSPAVARSTMERIRASTEELQLSEGTLGTISNLVQRVVEERLFDVVRASADTMVQSLQGSQVLDDALRRSLQSLGSSTGSRESDASSKSSRSSRRSRKTRQRQVDLDDELQLDIDSLVARRRYRGDAYGHAEVPVSQSWSGPLPSSSLSSGSSGVAGRHPHIRWLDQQHEAVTHEAVRMPVSAKASSSSGASMADIDEGAYEQLFASDEILILLREKMRLLRANLALYDR